MPLVILIGSITFGGIAGDIELYEPQFATEETLVCVQPRETPLVEPEPSKTPSTKSAKVSKRKKKKSSNKLLGTFKTTAYCPCYECSEGYGRTTATGHKATDGRTIAVDKSVIPYGTTVYIEGLGIFVAEDTGGGVNKKHIDIYVDSHKATFKSKYNQNRKVWIVKESEKK